VRPVNLIPEEQRRSRAGVSRTGPLAYIVVGALFALLAGVVMLVLTSNQISDRKAEVASLKTAEAAATARAEKLAPYVSFKQVADQRTQTVASLADSRFDWARVIRQLSLILPPHVWLTTLTGSAGGGGEGGGESAASIAGPSLAMSGCARGQNAVAGLVASLKEIDGVTRVGLENSALASTGGAEAASAASREGGCKGATFSLVVAFDAAPPSPDSSAGSEEAAAEAPASSESSEESSSESSSTESSAASAASPAEPSSAG